MKTKRIIMIIAIILVIVLIGLVGYTIYQKATFTKQNPVATMEIEGIDRIIPRSSSKYSS